VSFIEVLDGIDLLISSGSMCPGVDGRTRLLAALEGLGAKVRVSSDAGKVRPAAATALASRDEILQP
jgi:hypothetical protein